MFGGVKGTVCGRDVEADEKRDGVYLIQQGVRQGWLTGGEGWKLPGHAVARSIQPETTTLYTRDITPHPKTP
jgi:hypothetical protein